MRQTDGKVAQDIEDYGWHVIKVLEDESGPAFAYSIGLFHSFEHPEVFICGLPLDIMHQIINNLGDDIQNGITYEAGRQYGGVLEGFDVAFRGVQPKHYDAYFGRAQVYYGSGDFAVLQCFWPDKAGCFPWQDDFNRAWSKKQPLLFI